MKRCTRCGRELPIDQFAIRRVASGSGQSWCRDCHKAYAARRYLALPPDRIRSYRYADRERVARVRERVWAYLRGQVCADCGEDDVLVLEFDHLEEKLGNVGDLVNGAAWARIEAEIQKCEVVCANCHHLRTTKQRADEAANGTGRPRRARTAVTVSAISREVDITDVGAEMSTAETLVCGRCHRVRPIECFAWRSTERQLRQPWCRDCHNAHKRSFYADNRVSEIARVSRRRERLAAENTLKMRRYLSGHPCVDCGEDRVEVLEFDHLRDKRRDVTAMVLGGYLWSSIEAEIAKCEVRCANDHRRRTARQRGYADRKRGLAEAPAIYGRPRAESNRRLRFRRPMLYPLSYGVVGGNSIRDAASGTG